VGRSQAEQEKKYLMEKFVAKNDLHQFFVESLKISQSQLAD